MAVGLISYNDFAELVLNMMKQSSLLDDYWNIKNFSVRAMIMKM